VAVVLVALLGGCNVLTGAYDVGFGAPDGGDGGDGGDGRGADGVEESGVAREASADGSSDLRDARALLDGAVYWAVNGHVYVAVESALSWGEARTGAEHLGGHLATITSDEENTFVFGLAVGRPALWSSSGSGPWLGGQQQAGQNDAAAGWAWVTGEPFSYTQWRSGQPDDGADGGEDGIQLIGWSPEASTPSLGWNDRNGLTKAPSYIVEIE